MTDPFVILFLIITPVMMIGLAVRQAQIQKLLKNLLPSKWEGYGVWGDWIDAERQSHDCRIEGLSRKIDEKEKLDLIVLEQRNKNYAALKDQLSEQEEKIKTIIEWGDLQSQNLDALGSKIKSMEGTRNTDSLAREFTNVRDLAFSQSQTIAKLEGNFTTLAYEIKRLTNIQKATISKPRIPSQRRAISAPKARVKANGARHASR